MTQLIVRRGMVKTAAEEDGPPFEQQFGILANAVITEKFPQLDNMKLAFQLIDKSEDNSEAVGVMTYVLGRNVVYVPAFFKNQKLKTGDMMYLAKEQQFLPLSDPWLAYIKDRDVNESGELVPSESFGSTDPGSALAREYADPITKTSALNFAAMVRLPCDLEKPCSGASVLDAALQMGKKASEALCDSLTRNRNFLNAALKFYSGDALDSFAKKAYAMADTQPKLKLILPFTKEAAALSAEEQADLKANGYFIKTAEAADPAVLKRPQISGMFGTVDRTGRVQLLGMDGTLHEVLVLALRDDCCEEPCCSCCSCEPHTAGDPGTTAAGYMSRGNGFAVLYDGCMAKLPAGSMMLLSGCTPFDAGMLRGKGSFLDGVEELDWDDWLMFPDGTCRQTGRHLFSAGRGKWMTRNGEDAMAVSSDDSQENPVELGNLMLVPSRTRVVKAETSTETPRAKLPCVPVKLETFDAFLNEFCRRHYSKARVYSNGSEFEVSGDKTASAVPSGKGEAAYRLVSEYGVSPAIANEMLKGAHAGASYDSPKVETYFIEKTASDPMWQDSDVPMDEHANRPAQTEYRNMPAMLESPEQLEQAVVAASQNGIKEVFDVTALKLLVRQTQFFDEIAEDIPLFMRTLDALCRKLFQFYWHTDKMEEKYGMSKLKSLEDSLKSSIDSLSELTIFFKLRTVDGSGSTGDALGDLMSGRML